MPSAETDKRGRRERGKAQQLALDLDRQGRDRKRDRADLQVPPSHGQKSRRLPGVRTDEPL